MFSAITRSEVARQRMTLADYLSLYEPFLDYMLQALVHKNALCMEELSKTCRELKNK